MSGEARFIIILVLIIAVLAGVFVWKIANPKEETDYTESNVDNYLDNKEEIAEKYDVKETIDYMKKQQKMETLLWFATIAMLIIAYLLEAIAIYKIAKLDGTERAWLAFIPFVQWYLIAKIAFDGDILFGLIYIVGHLIGLIWKNNIMNTIISVVSLYILYGLFKKFDDKPNHKLGNLIALELISTVLATVLLYVLYRQTLSVEIIVTTILIIPSLVQGIYMYRFSKKIAY